MSVKIGYNMTAPHHLEMVNAFFTDGQIDYVELLADNFFNIQASEIEKIKAPLALHIMRSAFFRRRPRTSQLYGQIHSGDHGSSADVICE